MNAIRLEELSAATIVAVNRLGLKPGQEQFVSPVSYSAAAAVTPAHSAWQRVVLDDDRVVGFIHGNFDPDAQQEEFRAALWRINVDADAQGKGVGTFAVNALIDEARARAPQHRLVTIEDVGNMAAGLASDAARNVTGNISYVDAGYHVMS